MRYFILGFMAVLVLALSMETRADVLLGAWSTHFNSDYEYNEQHNLVAVEMNSYVAGYFKNSYNRDTVFIAKEFSKRSIAGTFGLMAGVMRGYTVCYGEDYSNTDVCPMLAPYYKPPGTVTPRFLLFGNAAAVAINVKF